MLFKVQTPTGIVDVEGPDDATDEELINAAQQDHAQQSTIEPEAKATTYNPDDYQNDTLQIGNPFGKNIDTHIPLSPSIATGLAGAGSLLTDQGLALKQIFSKEKTLQQLIDEKDQAEEKRKLDAPLMANRSAKVGKFLGAVTEGIATAPVAGAGYIGAIGTGAGLGSLEPTTNDESRINNILLGGTLGAGGKFGGDSAIKLLLGKKAAQAALASPQALEKQAAERAAMTEKQAVLDTIKQQAADAPTSSLTGTQKGLMDFGDRVGFKLTQGQRTGNKALLQHEASLSSNPLTSATFNDMAEHNSRLATRIAAHSIGENTDDISGQVLKNAKKRIGGIYEMVADSKPREVGQDEFLSRLSSIESDLNNTTTLELSNHPLVKQFINQASKENFTGKTLQDLSSKLNRAASHEITSNNGNRELGFALNDVKDMADDYLARGLDGKTAAMFKEARGQYRNLKMLDKYGKTINPGTGRVSVNLLSSALGQDKAGMKYLGNETPLYDLARWNDAFRGTIGDSGSATRLSSMINSPTEIPGVLIRKAAGSAYSAKPVAKGIEGIINARDKLSNVVNRGLLKDVNPKTVKALKLLSKQAAPLGLLYSQGD